MNLLRAAEASEFLDNARNLALHDAVKSGDTNTVEKLLNNASIVSVDSNKNSALHLSFLHRYDRITDVLLDFIVNNSNYINLTNTQGLTHLHVACSRNNVAAVEGFLKDEANVGDIVKADSPSLYAGYNALHFAIEFKSLEAAKVLLAAGAKMKDDGSSNSGQSPLQLLQQDRDDYLIMSDHLDKKAFPYFHLACLKESVSVVKKFIDRGADVNEAIEWGASLCDHYTPLHCAIESPYDRKEKVKLLLQHGATVEQRKYHREHKHMTALHLAFYNEYRMSPDVDGTIVNCLYKAVKDREENIVDANGLSYFHIAVTRNNFGAVEMYLNNGADIDQVVSQNNRGFSGYTALHFALKYELEDMAKFLIVHGADVNAGSDGKHQTPLWKAFQIRNISLIEILFESGGRFDKSDTFGNTLLHCAAEVSDPEVLKHLVDSDKYEVDAKNNFGQTALIVNLKSERPSRKVVEILIEAGTDLDVTDYFGDNKAVKIIDSKEWILKNGDKERFEIFKIAYEKICRSKQNIGRFEFPEIASAEDVKMLLETGIDLSVTNYFGQNLVHLLVRNSNPGVIQQLRQRNLDIDTRDMYGWTPLLYAAFNNHADTVEFLLDEGADIEAAQTDIEDTALSMVYDEYVNNTDFKKTIQILLERGANAQMTLVDGSTIFDIVELDALLRDSKSELLLAHLAFQEANGTTITRQIRSKIDSRDELKSYFEKCKQQLSVEIYRSVTLFNALIASERKMERYLRNAELAAKIKDFQAVDYFNNILKKRIIRATRMVELRKNAAPFTCKLMKIHVGRYPGIADEIAGYLDEQDLKHLILI